MTCRNCGQQRNEVCVEHGACLVCHELEMRHLVRERDTAHQYIQQLQSQPTEPKQRTWADRTIGSQWNPNDPTEVDDIDATCATIEKVLFAIGG